MNRSEIVADYKETFDVHLAEAIKAATIARGTHAYDTSDGSSAFTALASEAIRLYETVFSKREMAESGGSIAENDVKALLLPDEITDALLSAPKKDYVVTIGALSYMVINAVPDAYQAMYALQLRERKVNV